MPAAWMGKVRNEGRKQEELIPKHAGSWVPLGLLWSQHSLGCSLHDPERLGSAWGYNSGCLGVFVRQSDPELTDASSPAWLWTQLLCCSHEFQLPSLQLLTCNWACGIGIFISRRTTISGTCSCASVPTASF